MATLYYPIARTPENMRLPDDTALDGELVA
jgi:hypothetical protein